MSINEVLLMSDADTVQSVQTNIIVGSVVVPIEVKSDPANLNKPLDTYVAPKLKPNPIYDEYMSNKNYGFAIVVQVNPTLILVSEKADMRWAGLNIADFKPIGNATPAALAIANTRLLA